MAWWIAASPMIIRLFVVIDPLGSLPVILTTLSRFSPKRARQIALREMFAALIVMLFFTLFGSTLLRCIEVDPKSMGVAGGSVLLVIAAQMVLPQNLDSGEAPLKEEPFIFPLAVPLIVGPSVMATLIDLAQVHSISLVISAMMVAWVVSTVILVGVHRLKRYLGIGGVTALERLMGIVLAALSMQMIFEGLHTFYGVSQS